MATKPADSSAEEKIKEAARKLFTQKGFAATKTRDIALEAGMNTALLNYYFRSKEKLFEIIMMEAMQEFMKGISVLVNEEETSLEQKLEGITGMYIDKFLAQPDIPSFILNEVRNDPTRLATMIGSKLNMMDSVLMKQVKSAVQSGKLGVSDPKHFFVNMLGMLVFPFIAKPMVQLIFKADEEQYKAFLMERKKLIPKWIMACFAPS